MPETILYPDGTETSIHRTKPLSLPITERGETVKEILENHEFMNVIGQGEIGDKARQLAGKSKKLQEIGFAIPRRTVLAEGFLNDFLIYNEGSRLDTVYNSI